MGYARVPVIQPPMLEGGEIGLPDRPIHQARSEGAFALGPLVLNQAVGAWDLAEKGLLHRVSSDSEKDPVVAALDQFFLSDKLAGRIFDDGRNLLKGLGKTCSNTSLSPTSASKRIVLKEGDKTYPLPKGILAGMFDTVDVVARPLDGGRWKLVIDLLTHGGTDLVRHYEPGLTYDPNTCRTDR